MLWRVTHRRPPAILGQGVRVSGRLMIVGPGRVVIGDRCEFAGEAGAPNVLITSSPESEIVIGDGTRRNGAHLQAAASIRLGRDCLVADCHVLDTDFHTVDPVERKAGVVPPPRPVIIGDEVWICSRAAILKGVTIGDRAVIGYRAVVRRDVPADVVVICHAAQVVKTTRQRPSRSVRQPSR